MILRSSALGTGLSHRSQARSIGGFSGDGPVFASPLPLLGQSGGGRKAKAIAVKEATKEMLWMKRFLRR
jgi:hypothetical protein